MCAAMKPSRTPQSALPVRGCKPIERIHSPRLPTAFGRGNCGGWFGCCGLHTGFLVGHGQHLPLLLGEFSGNRGVLDAGAGTASRMENM